MTEAIKLYWFRGQPANFGDDLNPYLVERIGKTRVRFCDPSSNSDYFMCVGSVLHHPGQYMNKATIWGSGFMSLGQKIRQPKSILAVRGPLTRQEFIRQGIDCPPIYGDPALLLPRFYKPTVSDRFRLGIIPHFVDIKHPWITQYRGVNKILVLNVSDPIEKFLNDLNSCQAIISSSLHGVIAADAYGIPSLWVEFSDDVKGRGFKFRDYFLSIGVKSYDAHQIRDASVAFGEVMASIRRYKIDIDLDKLISVCPFKAKTK